MRAFVASLLLSLASYRALAQDFSSRCEALVSFDGIENTTITNATYYSGPAAVDGVPPSQCTLEAAPSNISVPLCRVSFIVETSQSSQIKGEMWLPDEWYGRFLVVGNGGLNGCVDYSALDYGSSFHFATVSGNNGHDGGFSDGKAFYKHPEVLKDFTTRGIHTITIVGKEFLKQYYSRPSDKSYYLGCSGGGRQGAYAALHFPDDFDGIVAGAPGVDWNNSLGGGVLLSKLVGAPNGTTSPSFITEEQWGLVHKEVLRQCDALDGVVDEIITEPDACPFQPLSLLCSADANANNATNCLTSAQVGALKKIYSPIYGSEGQMLYPGYQPGAESTYTADIFGGEIVSYSAEWFRYVVFEDPTYDFREFGPKDAGLAEAQDPGKISTFDGHFDAFRARGGKFLSYHGTHDNLIPPTNSKRLYNLTAETLETPVLDEFYRLFLVPGMSHCVGGEGAYKIGQNSLGIPPVNDTTHNVLLAMVDWVEADKAPDSFVGTGDDGHERVVCRYPVEKNVWDGETYVCQ